MIVQLAVSQEVRKYALPYATSLESQPQDIDSSQREQLSFQLLREAI